MSTECQNTVLAGPAKVTVAPLGATKEQGTSLGFTSGGVTITKNTTKTAIRVDQSLLPIRHVTTEEEITVSVPLASITLDNIQKAFNVTLASGTGTATINPEVYYQLWIDTQGVIDDNGVKADREYYFAKVSFTSNDGLVLSSTEAQTLTLEGYVVNCPDADGNNAGFMSVTETYPEGE